MSQIANTLVTTSARSAGDRFLSGLSVMLLVNILQRLVGLLRNLGFCNLLSDAELGEWAMANSFFVLAAPLAVLGLPGSFGKFVEIYRRQGALGNYCRSLALISGCGLIGLSLSMWIFPESFAWLVFNDRQSAQNIGWLISTLAAVTVFNFLNELMSALRQVRVVSAMQFINSVGFAILGVSGLYWTHTWTVLLPAYTASCLLALLPGLWVLHFGHAHELRRTQPTIGMWRRVIPFAITLWCMNLLTNLFDVCDRALLLHLTPGDASIGQALIGQYHCGRILPNLLLSVASLLTGVLLPYLSADFEAGENQRLRTRLQQVLHMVAFGFGFVAVAAILASPLLFDLQLKGRYEEAREILPLALLQCIWMSLFLVAQTYLFCVERGRQVTMILIFGLLINGLLNYPLIACFGLTGSVGATTLASGIILALVLWRIGRCGQPLGWRTALVCFAPGCIALL